MHALPCTLPQTLCLIPLRANSQRLPGKNIKPILDKPLVAWTIETARRSGAFSRIVVATDGPEIARVSLSYGADEIIQLPPALTHNCAPVIDALQFTAHTLNERAALPSISVLLEATSLRLPHHITEALTLLQSSDVDSVVSVIPVAGNHHPDWLIHVSEDGEAARFNGEPLSSIPARKQDLSPLYTRNGAIYAFRSELLLQEPPTIYGARCRAYCMDPAFNVDIDTQEDFENAKPLFQKYLAAV